MKLPPSAIAGTLLILLGAFTLWHPVFHGPATRQTIELADRQTTVETHRVVSIPHYLSGLVIAAGALLAFSAWLPEAEAHPRRNSARGGSRRGPHR
jgi:hypothetical protein